MKRMMFALVALALVVSVDSVSAFGKKKPAPSCATCEGGVGTPVQQTIEPGMAPEGYGDPYAMQGHGQHGYYQQQDSGYGWSPFWMKFSHGKLENRQGGPAPSYGYGAPQTPVGGTLVFPNHPFARSPRDFFMTE